MKWLVVTAFQSVFTSASAGAFCCEYGYPIQLLLLANLLLCKNFVISIQVFHNFLTSSHMLRFPYYTKYISIHVVQFNIHTITFCKSLIWYTVKIHTQHILSFDYFNSFFHAFLSLYQNDNSHRLFLQCWFTAIFTIFWASHVMVTCYHNIIKARSHNLPLLIEAERYDRIIVSVHRKIARSLQ